MSPPPSRPSKQSSSWHLNDNLLRDYLCVADISQAIKDFQTDHTSDQSNPLFKCEALKCVLHGVFIHHGSRLKKARAATSITQNFLFGIYSQIWFGSCY